MATSEAGQKEIWTTARTIEETTLNLYNIKDKDGFRKYLQYAKWYVHRVSLYNPPPSFDINRNDLSTKVKGELTSYSKNKSKKRIKQDKEVGGLLRYTTVLFVLYSKQYNVSIRVP